MLMEWVLMVGRLRNVLSFEWLHVKDSQHVDGLEVVCLRTDLRNSVTV